MQAQKPTYPIQMYDSTNDVFYIYLGSQYDAFADEEYPNIYVMRNDADNQIVGFKILDFKNNKSKFELQYPQYTEACEKVLA